MTLVSNEKRSLFQTYASEFESRYLFEPAGQKHLAAYKKERDEVIRFWAEIKQAKYDGKSVTKMVLEKLLPYSNTRPNRERGYRISVTPAINNDLKKWFENVGWQKPDNWDNVANAIYDLVYDLIEKDDWNSLTRFEKNLSVSKGFKAGLITPTFYFLNPRYRIINSKTVDTLNFLLAHKTIRTDLSHYKEYLEIINQALEELSIPLFSDADTFDAFCHWMCDRRLGGYARAEPPSEASEEEEGPAAFEEAEIESPHDHWEAIYYLVSLGNCLGFKTYVADPSRMAFDKRLGDIATLSDVPPLLKSAPQIARVDVIWFGPKSTPRFFLFEVEDGGTMRDALHRLYNMLGFDAGFFIVSPEHNRSKFERWVRTDPYQEYEEKYNFRTYTELLDFYQEAVNFTLMRRKFFSEKV